jgi:hypothetical protein
MTRTQRNLGILLLVQLALILLIRQPFSSASRPTEAHALLPDLEAFTATRVELAGKDDAALTLVKRGDDWTVEEAGGFPADGTKVTDLIDSLREIEVRRPVVSSSRYHEGFKVADDENEARVKLFDESSGDPRVDLILGTSPNYRLAHVRLAGENEVYEARGIAPYDVRAEASTWTMKELLDVAEDQLVGLTVDNAQGSFELERIDGAWKVAAPQARAGAVLDTDKVDALLGAARTIRLADPVGAVDETSHGFADASATVTLRWNPAGAVAMGGEEGISDASVEEAVVRIGSKVADKETQRYVTRDGFGFTGTVWESSIKKLLDDGLDALTGDAGA